jgi:hypothetical protein
MRIGKKNIHLDEYTMNFVYWFRGLRDRQRIKLWLAKKPRIETLTVEGLKALYREWMCPQYRMPGDEAFRRLYRQIQGDK